jgi:hypothetical protein
MNPSLAKAWIRLSPAAALLIFALPMAASAADSAQIFKCTDATGNVTYQNEPCPKASKSGRIELFDNRWTATKEEREAEWRRNASERRVATGMPARWVREALGEPTEIRDTPTAGAAQLWLYTLPERSVQLGMLNDQVLWFRETPTARTGQGSERPVTEPPAPQISRSAPPVERPANLPTTRLAPTAPERPPVDSARSLTETARPPPTASERPAAEAPAAPTTVPRTAEATAAPSEASVQGGRAITADAAQGSAAGANVTTTGTAAKPNAARSIARGQDCKQVLADLGPPTRRRDVPAIDTSSDPATEYFYESTADAGRLRIVCSNGKVEGVDRSVAR